ncbi:N-acetylneuraminate synthase family protein [Verrucomicrobiota bacterium]
MIKAFKIAQKTVGEKESCFIIAEMGLSHDGNFDSAHAFIDAAAENGADAVKFQTHIADAESTPREEFRVKGSFKDATRYDYWKRTAFSEGQWQDLKNHADDKKIIFLSSPFSQDAVDLLLGIGVPAWKIASGETNNYPMLEEMTKTGLPFLLSTGMSRMAEIDRAVELILKQKCPLILYQCTNRYPCPSEHIGFNVIEEYRKRYNVPIGFSDHSGEVCAGIAAYCMGACSLEVHVVSGREVSGPDVSSSLTFEEFNSLVSSIRFLERVFNSPVDKEKEASDLEEVRLLFTKSIVLVRDVKKGTKIIISDIAFKKPGVGITPGEVKNVLGKKVVKDLSEGEFLSWEHLTDE